MSVLVRWPFEGSAHSAHAELSLDEIRQTPRNLRMPRNWSGSARRWVEVDIVRVSVSLENASGIGQLTNQLTAFQTSTVISVLRASVRVSPSASNIIR